MSLISRDLARVLGSTAIVLVLTGAVAKADPAVTMDGAAYRYSAGSTDTTSGNTFEAATSGPTKRAWGMLVYNGSIANVSDTTVITSGAKAHGIQVGAKGGNADGADHSAINLGNGVNVTTSGNDSYGLHAIDAGKISGTATVGTTGARAYGAFAESFSTIDLTGGSITTSGSLAYGLLANNDMNTVGGKIIATDVDIATASSWTFGAYAKNGGEVTLNRGSITTTGERAYGILASTNGDVTSSASIDTKGYKAHGVQAGASNSERGGSVVLSGGSVETHGDEAYGLHAYVDGSISGTTSITTHGANSFGAFAESDSSISLTDTTIVTKGAGAHGLLANLDGGTNAGVIDATNTNITTNGLNAYGAFADKGAQITLAGGSITASGDNSNAAQVQNGSTLTVSGLTLKSVRGVGIGLTDNAVVTLNQTTISSAQETFLSNLNTAGLTQTINLGDGTVATQNNGTLLKVNRSQKGGDGNVNLTLQAGATASGDIVDTDSTKTTGDTHIRIEEGATYNGKIQGVTNVVAETGTNLVFEDGTVIKGNITGTSSTFSFAGSGASIGGDVELNNASSTHGGSIGTPITVGGNVLVDPTSIMGGNWDIAGDLSANGTITPGNSIGVVKVGGDATFGADSVYAVEIAGDGTSDRIDVTGKATLQGGTVEVTALDDKVSYQDGQTYTILTAGGGVDGQFSEAVSKSIFLTAELQHLANEVDLTVGLVADPVDPENPPAVFENVAQTNNQLATARALDSLEQSGSSLELYNSVLFLATEDEARDAFNQLSGDTHASVKTGLIDTANLTADAINNRLRSAFAGVAAKDAPVLSFAQSPKGSAPRPFDGLKPASYDYGVWASGFGSWVDHDGNANMGGLKSTTGGFLSGVDVGFASGWRLGVVGGYSQTDIDAKGRYASATSDNWHLGVYGGNQWGPIGLRAGLVQTWHSIDSSRSVSYTGFSDSLDADYDARSFQAFGELGYRIDMAAASFEPFANLSHVRLHTDGFTEKGGAAALSVNSETTNTTFTTLGLRASAPVQLGATTANLKGTLGWRHAYGDITPESTQYFAGSNAFTVEGVAIAKDAALVEAGLDVAITEASTLGLSYVGQFGNDTTQNGFNATLNVRF